MGVMAERLQANLASRAGYSRVRILDGLRAEAYLSALPANVAGFRGRRSATQDTFLKAWQALKRPESKDLDDPGKWLTRIAVNTCLDRLRSRRWQFWRKRPNPEDETAILALARATNPNAEDRVFATQIAQRLEQALQRLSLRQRAAFTLRHYEDRSLAEIAEVLDLDVGTVKVHLFRAIEKLREELHDLYFRDREEK